MADYLFPELNVHPTSGLLFPWSEFVSRSGSTFDMAMGHQEGTALGMCMLIDYNDLEEAIPQLLGYSIRDTSTGTPTLRRFLPFRHPRWSQLWCTKIVKVQGLKFIDKEEFHVVAFDDQVGGPVPTYQNLLLTLQFTRPNYPILSDDDVIIAGEPNEWLRYTFTTFQPNTQMLQREGTTYQFSEGAANGNNFPGSVGVAVSKTKIEMTWYQIPADAVLDDSGFPSHILIKDATDGANPADNIPRTGTVNVNTFMGRPASTLLYETAEPIIRPLPMPPILMGIAGEAFQNQYDLKFHLQYFNPPLGTNVTSERGFQTMPWSADGRWYPIKSMGGPVGVPPTTKPYQTSDFANLFKLT